MEEDGRKLYYVLWSKVANANRWFRYGIDANNITNKRISQGPRPFIAFYAGFNLPPTPDAA